MSAPLLPGLLLQGVCGQLKVPGQFRPDRSDAQVWCGTCHYSTYLLSVEPQHLGSFVLFHLPPLGARPLTSRSLPGEWSIDRAGLPESYWGTISLHAT